MERTIEIPQIFNKLKEKGLEAKNPDQSVAMTESFYKIIEICRWKGFSESDMEILFHFALAKND